jgi:hypothetical protein
MDTVANKTTITLKPDLGDYRGLLKALNLMDKASQSALKDDVASISRWTATEITTAATYSPMYKQAIIVANSVKPARDRVPTITIGGSKTATVSRKVTAGNPAPKVGQLLFGNEFGGERNAKDSVSGFPNGGYKFPARSPREGRGNAGYWIFPTLKAVQPTIKRRWQEAVVNVLDIWARNS